MVSSISDVIWFVHDNYCTSFVFFKYDSMLLFLLKDTIASHSILDIFDFQGCGFACMMLRSRYFKYKSNSGSLPDLGVKLDGL